MRRINTVCRLVIALLWGFCLAASGLSPASAQPAAPASSVNELQRQYREALQEIERLRRQLDAANRTIARLKQSPRDAKAPPAQPQTYQEAIATLTRILKNNPQDAQAYRKRGIAYAHTGDYTSALADLDRAIALNRADAEAYNQRGIVYYKLGRYPQAMTDFNRAIAKQPKLAQTYNNRGVLYKTLGNYQRALADLRKAKQLGLTYAAQAIDILRSDVRQAQQRLQRAGFNPGPADGLPGAATAAALRAYQRQRGLRVTGHLDNRTQQALGMSSAPSLASRTSHTGANAKAILSRFIDKPPLEYPLKARQEGWEGTVTLRFEMLTDGSVGKIEVAKSSGYAILDTAARNALKQWRHRPPKDQDQPKPSWATLDFNFTLDPADTETSSR